MCLSWIDATEKCPEEGEGFKVFCLMGSERALGGDFCSEGVERPVGCWLDEADFRPPKARPQGIGIYRGTESEAAYPNGWHIFIRRDSAERWASDMDPSLVEIRRVRFRGGHTYGHQDGAAVIVAREIFILPAAESRWDYEGEDD